MVLVHGHALKHGLSEEDVRHAWDYYWIGAVRVPGEREVRIGPDLSGRGVEMVGALLGSGDWLVYHALTPPSARMLREVDDARRGRSEL